MHRQPIKSKWRKFWSSHTQFARQFVIATDFNMEPDQLWETGWVQSLGQKANIVVPEVVHTCTTGRGLVIDFAVISDSLTTLLIGSHTSAHCAVQTTHWDMFAVHGNSHTGPRVAGLRP